MGEEKSSAAARSSASMARTTAIRGLARIFVVTGRFGVAVAQPDPLGLRRMGGLGLYADAWCTANAPAPAEQQISTDGRNDRHLAAVCACADACRARASSSRSAWHRPGRHLISGKPLHGSGILGKDRAAASLTTSPALNRSFPAYGQAATRPAAPARRRPAGRRYWRP